MVSPIPVQRQKAIETGSGITWGEWLEILEPHRDKTHGAIALVAFYEIKKRAVSSSPEWWAQGVTVAYEQHIGRRKVGQMSDGTFSVTVSRTVNGSMDEALDAWIALIGDVREYSGTKVVDAPRISKTDEWRYWRCTLEDGSTLSVNIQEKPGGEKSIIAINQDKLLSEDKLEDTKAYWKGFIADL
ncbi:MAG: hypothetical protein ACREGE_02655 [Candidatus Microsaccharimonas sp.]